MDNKMCIVFELNLATDCLEQLSIPMPYWDAEQYLKGCRERDPEGVFKLLMEVDV